MKWPSVLLVCALALLSHACEQHKASELEDAHGHSAGPAEHKAEEKKAEDGKPGEAPKFFPEKK